MRYFAFIVFCVLLSWQCRDVEYIDLDFGYDYFPTEIGHYRIYGVDSTVYDFATDSLSFVNYTASFQLKLEVTDSFIASNNQVNYVLKRSVREDASAEWIDEAEWVINRQSNKAELVEDNRRFVKMVFPPKKDESWDGNQFFDTSLDIVVAGETIEMFKNWNYKILSNDTVFSNIDTQFDNVLHIQMADDENAIERRFGEEMYARGVGLLYQKLMILDTQCIVDCLEDSWEEKAEKGFILEMYLIDYGIR